MLYSYVKFLDQVIPVTLDINNQNLNELLNEPLSKGMPVRENGLCLCTEKTRPFLKFF